MSELDSFLETHPDTRFVDALFVDLCGVTRGKRFPLPEAPKLFGGGMQIPYSIYFLDVTGACHDPCGRGVSDGDPDGTAVPVPGTLVPVPWAVDPMAQVLMTMFDDAGAPSDIEPRNVARRVLTRFVEELGLTPVVAFELEFYLLDTEPDGEGRPQRPLDPLTGKRLQANQVYSLSELDKFADVFRDIESAAVAQRIPATIANAEYAPGQFEINLRHVDDAVAAADHCALLRRLVRAVACRLGLRATFMAKPFPEQTGNGMHIHMSLLDRNGINVFQGANGGPGETMKHAIAGMQRTLGEAMAILSPNLNAYRRLQPNLFVPVNTSWGPNNRSVAFRVPAGAPSATRIEHRVAAADANPYLVLAALLAGAYHGIVNALDPGLPATGNTSGRIDETLPLDWPSSIERLSAARILRDYLGPDYVALYADTKRKELEKFHSAISPREYEWYL